MWPSFLFPFSCHPAQSISFSSSLPPPLSSPPTYFWPPFCSRSYFHFVLPFFPLHFLVSFIHPLWPAYLFFFLFLCLVSLCTKWYMYCYLYLFMPCTLCYFLLYLHTSPFFIPYHELSISPRRPFHLPPPSTHSTDMSLGIVRGNIAACVSFFILATCSGIPTNFWLFSVWATSHNVSCMFMLSCLV